MFPTHFSKHTATQRLSDGNKIKWKMKQQPTPVKGFSTASPVCDPSRQTLLYLYIIILASSLIWLHDLWTSKSIEENKREHLKGLWRCCVQEPHRLIAGRTSSNCHHIEAQQILSILLLFLNPFFLCLPLNNNHSIWWDYAGWVYWSGPEEFLVLSIVSSQPETLLAVLTGPPLHNVNSQRNFFLELDEPMCDCNIWRKSCCWCKTQNKLDLWYFCKMKCNW